MDTSETEQPADPTARQIEICHALADLGMQLARATAARALREAEEAGTTPLTRRGADPNLTFVRISSEIRRVITLATRLAAVPATTTRAPKPRPVAPPVTATRRREREPAWPDNRRAALHQAMDILIHDQPHRDDMRDRFIIEFERRLAEDRRYAIPAALILLDAAEKLGLDAEAGLFPPELYEELLPPRFRRNAPSVPPSEPEIQIAA